MSATSRPSFIGGALFPSTTAETMPLLAVCDRNGKVGWLPTSELHVVSIDGVRPQNADEIGVLTEGWRFTVDPYECPKCNRVLREVTYAGCCIECGAQVVPPEAMNQKQNAPS